MVFYRVDNRLIHGQITFSWVSTYQLDAIYVIDDKLWNSKFEKENVENFGSLSMGGKKVEVLSEEEAGNRLNDIEKAGGKVLVIFKEPLTVYRIMKSGKVKFVEMNVANMGVDKTRESAKFISKSLGSVVYLMDDEIAALKELQNMGVKLYQQVLADSERKEIKL